MPLRSAGGCPTGDRRARAAPDPAPGGQRPVEGPLLRDVADPPASPAAARPAPGPSLRSATGGRATPVGARSCPHRWDRGRRGTRPAGPPGPGSPRAPGRRSAGWPEQLGDRVIPARTSPTPPPASRAQGPGEGAYHRARDRPRWRPTPLPRRPAARLRPAGTVLRWSRGRRVPSRRPGNTSPLVLSQAHGCIRWRCERARGAAGPAGRDDRRARLRGGGRAAEGPDRAGAPRPHRAAHRAAPVRTRARRRRCPGPAPGQPAPEGSAGRRTGHRGTPGPGGHLPARRHPRRPHREETRSNTPRSAAGPAGPRPQPVAERPA